MPAAVLYIYNTGCTILITEQKGRKIGTVECRARNTKRGKEL